MHTTIILNSITMKYMPYFPDVAAQILFIYNNEQIGSQNMVYTRTCYLPWMCNLYEWTNMLFVNWQTLRVFSCSLSVLHLWEGHGTSWPKASCTLAGANRGSLYSLYWQRAQEWHCLYSTELIRNYYKSHHWGERHSLMICYTSLPFYHQCYSYLFFLSILSPSCRLFCLFN